MQKLYGELKIEKKMLIRAVTFGLPRTGKTRFACTAPGPIGFIPLDINSHDTAVMLKEESGKKIFIPTEDLIRNPRAVYKMKKEDAISYYDKCFGKFLDVYFAMNADPAIRTIVVDTGTQLFDDILFRHFGRNQRVMPRDRGGPNQDIKDVMLSCRKHLIMTHKAREVWAGEGKDAKPTGRYEPKGCEEALYSANVVLEHKRVGLDFKILFHNCQVNKDLVKGNRLELVNDDCTFQMVGCMMYPESDLEDWE